MNTNEHMKRLVSSTPLRYNDHQNVAWRKEELEKFAELIIRECAMVVFSNTGPKSALNVLEHFGLKEEE